MADFVQHDWNAALERQCQRLIALARDEDLDAAGDVTSMAVVAELAWGDAWLVARQAGRLSGMHAAGLVLAAYGVEDGLSDALADGSPVAAGERLARLSGPARRLLAAERPMLNFLGRLSGIATLTAEYVEAVRATGAAIYDTRKTTPAWRRLEKYAVRCGGGHNHRTGLHDGILIKDNHLALAARELPQAASGQVAAEAVRRARRFVERWEGQRKLPVEVEVDTLEQLAAVLDESPDLALLDNMTLDELRSAVAMRDARCPATVLEASGGISLATVRQVAETGVDRISVGGLTHAAAWLDVALDWQPGPAASPA